MFKYLNHTFIKRDSHSKFIYVCEVCCAEIWHNVGDFYIKGNSKAVQYNEALTLTCEEMQIKNLLE